MSEKNDPHLTNLVEKAVNDFYSGVASETDPTNVLLKGHLYIENLLDEILTVYDISPKKISHGTFYSKIKTLEDLARRENFEQKRNIESAVVSLFALNAIRNNLAHSLTFKIDEPSVNRIGVTLGSSYVIEKYKNGQKRIRENLTFCLRKIVGQLGLIIYVKITLMNEKEQNES